MKGGRLCEATVGAWRARDANAGRGLFLWSGAVLRGEGRGRGSQSEESKQGLPGAGVSVPARGQQWCVSASQAQSAPSPEAPPAWPSRVFLCPQVSARGSICVWCHTQPKTKAARPKRVIRSTKATSPRQDDTSALRPLPHLRTVCIFSLLTTRIFFLMLNYRKK